MGGRKSFSLNLASDTLFIEHLLYAKSWLGMQTWVWIQLSAMGWASLGDCAWKKLSKDISKRHRSGWKKRSLFEPLTTCKCPIQSLNVELTSSTNIYSVLSFSVPMKLSEEIHSALQAEVWVFHPLLCWWRAVWAGASSWTSLNCNVSPVRGDDTSGASLAMLLRRGDAWLNAQ